MRIPRNTGIPRFFDKPSQVFDRPKTTFEKPETKTPVLRVLHKNKLPETAVK